MVIQYCRLSIVYGEIFSCTNMPTEVSVLDPTPVWLYRWGAQIAHSNTQSGGCMWHCRTHQTIHTITHTGKKKQVVIDNSLYMSLFAEQASVILEKPGGCGSFQSLLYLHIHTRICTFLLFHCLCSVAQIWASESLALSAIGSASRVISTPPTIPQPAVSIPPLRKEFAVPPKDQLSDV